MTLSESAARATLPWNSIDAGSAMFDALPQQSIDICLMCQHSASHCEHCGEWNTKKTGRHRKEYDADLLREMMTLRRCNKDICAALGVSERTLRRIKNALN